ncbi:MAG TPA: ribonuclease HIII [Bacillota bacterium]|nr:ribonuclease HIII [Bacillota bacterium]
MSQGVIHASEKNIQNMQQFYHDYLIDAPQGSIFRAKKPTVTITAYNSGKVLFQGKDATMELTKWDSNKSSPPLAKKTGTVPEHIFSASHIGSDESGTGDYFGPVTAASCYVTEENIEKLRAIGIQDSKNLTDEKALELSKQIVALKIPYALLTINNEKYNDLQQSGWSQGKMKAMIHHHVHRLLLEKIKEALYSGIVIDQFCEPSLYERYIQSENEQLFPKTYFTTKAESYSIAVAAASVIARAQFLKAMDKLSEKVGFRLLKGASAKVDEQIAKIITRDRSELYHCAKVHFANTKKAEQYL